VGPGFLGLQNRVLRLKSPTDEGSEAASPVLQLPQPVQMFNPVLDRFHMAEHHRGTGAQA